LKVLLNLLTPTGTADAGDLVNRGVLGCFGRDSRKRFRRAFTGQNMSFLFTMRTAAGELFDLE
jgi:hypothetical protein